MYLNIHYCVQAFSGLASAFPQLFGFFGSACFSWYVIKTKRYILTCKMVYALGAISAILMTEVS